MSSVRPCLGCGQSDDHPRHQVVIPPDMTSVFFHYDCHAQVSSCESCASVVKDAEGKTGDALRDHIMGKKG